MTTSSYDVVVAGAELTGLMTATRLQQAGVSPSSRPPTRWVAAPTRA